MAYLNGKEILFSPQIITYDGYDKGYKDGQIATLAESQYMHPTVTGTIISVNDVTPIEHNVGVKVASKNLLPYPYYSTSGEVNGITYTDAGDGAVGVNGTATKTAPFYFAIMAPIEAGIYTISGYIKNTGCGMPFYLYETPTAEKYYAFYNTKSAESITFEVPFASYFTWYISPETNLEMQGLSIFPQLERGEKATVFSSYVNDLSAVNLMVGKKNLFDINATTTISIAGYGSISNGIITSQIGYAGAYATWNSNIKFLSAGTYTLSCDIMADKTAGDKGFALGFIDLNGKRTVQSGQLSSYSTWERHSFTFTIDSDTKMRGWVFQSRGDQSNFKNLNIKFKNILLEKSSVATDYEPYEVVGTYTPNADGTVEGVKSISPNMTLIPNSNAVTVECEYLRDIDLYIDNLITNVALTGGE